MNANNPFSSLSQYAPSAAFNTSVETLVVQTLRSAITQGAFYPGQEIDEAAIAESLQISKMPVRQAIAALEVEGLVTKVPRKKVYVTSLDKHDIEEIYTTRIALEEVAIRAAVKKACERDYELLERNLAAVADGRLRGVFGGRQGVSFALVRPVRMAQGNEIFTAAAEQHCDVQDIEGAVAAGKAPVVAL